MKTRPVSALLLAAALVAPAVADPAGFSYAEEHDALRAPHGPGTLVVRGMEQAEVRDLLGAPSLQPSREVWIYRDFRGGHPQAGRTQTSLVVAFTGGRVAELRFTDRQGVRHLVTQAKAKTARPAVAIK